MADEIRKKLHYRRAEWAKPRGHPATLQDAVMLAFDNLPAVGGRTIYKSDGREISFADQERPKSGGVLVHITIDTPGEFASAVPTSKQNESSIEATLVSPPDTLEFMDGEAFVYINKSDVIFCSTHMTASLINSSIYELLKKANGPRAEVEFTLLNVIRSDVHELISRVGVERIDLKTSLYKATSSYNRRKTHLQGILGVAGKFAKAIIGRENDVTDDALKISISIATDNRMFSRKIALGEKELTDMSLNIASNIEADDDFTILLSDGMKITPDQINIADTFEMPKFAKSVHKDFAWPKLLQYYDSLKRSRVLEM